MEMEQQHIISAIELEFGHDSLKNLTWLSNSIGVTEQNVQTNLFEGSCSPLHYLKIVAWLSRFQNFYARNFLKALIIQQKADTLTLSNEPFENDTINTISYSAVLNYLLIYERVKLERIFKNVEINVDYDMSQSSLRLVRKTGDTPYLEEEILTLDYFFKLMIEFGSRIENTIWDADEIRFDLKCGDWERKELEEQYLNCSISKFAILASIEYQCDLRENYVALAQLTGMNPAMINKWLSLEIVPTKTTENKFLQIAKTFNEPLAQKVLREEISWKNIDFDLADQLIIDADITITNPNIDKKEDNTSCMWGCGIFIIIAIIFSGLLRSCS